MSRMQLLHEIKDHRTRPQQAARTYQGGACFDHRFYGFSDTTDHA